MKVVVPGDNRHGQVGIVDTLYELDSEFVYLKFDGDAETYAFRHTEVVPVRSDKEREATRTRTSQPLKVVDPRPAQKPKSTPASGQQRSRMKVAAPGDDHHGQIGSVDGAYGRDKDFVYLKFRGDTETYAFRHSEVVPADPDSQTAASRAPDPQPRASSPASAATRPDARAAIANNSRPPTMQRPVTAASRDGSTLAGFRGRWEQLSTSGRVVALAIPVTVIAVTAVGFGIFLPDGDTNGAGVTASTSSSDDWQRAVCRPGTFFNGQDVLRNSTGSAACTSLNGVPIGIATYTSQFGLENDVAIYRGGIYATTTTDSGQTYAFVPLTGSNNDTVQAALSPLTAYGFQIHSAP